MNSEFLEEELKLEFRCGEESSEKIKHEVGLWEEVSTFEIKKVKNKKLLRAKTLLSEKN